MKPIITKSKFTFIGRIFFLLFLLGITSKVNAQTLIAGWDFQTSTTGGTVVLASPNTPKVFNANFGSGTIYWDGTNNSSNWFVGVSNSELSAFTGTALNAGVGFSTTTTSPACLAILGGAANVANGKFGVFSFSMTGYINLSVSYASQRSTTGFNTHIWEYSTNGTTWIPLSTVATIPTAFGVISLPTTSGLDGATTAYLRFSATGATASSGNSRLDNIQLIATAGVTFNTNTISGSPFCISDDNGAVVNVPYTYGGTFNAGNVLTAELSSSTGSFASPVSIGTLSTTTSTGTISSIIPAGTLSGSGYRIRVVSSDPVAMSNNNGANLIVEKVVAVASNNGPVCSGLSLQLFSSGGSTYSWTGPNGFSNSNQNPTIATTVAADSGVYIATTISTLGCTDTASTLAIVQTCSCLPPTITSSVQQPSCNGGSNGSIDITVSGGVSPYTFQWSTGALTEDISGVSAGVYSVIVTDFILCTDTFYITAGEPTLMSPSVIVTHPGCPGTSDGSINLSVSGGTPGYTYLWDTGALTEDVSGLPAGLYSVTITDNNGCITYAFGVLTNPGPFSLSSINTNVACAGINSGSINLIASNDTSNNSNPGILISEFLANPAGADSSKEWVELVATKFINFASTPYTVIVANNGGGTTKGWVQGGVASATTNGTYAFEISSGIVSAGTIFYVGGSNMAVTGLKLRVIDVSTTGGDGGIGTATAGGILGNGGTNADGIAVFNAPVATLDSNSVPVDAIFFGTGTGGAVVNAGVDGFTLPNNDRYAGGRLQTTSFIGPDAGVNDIHVIATGGYNTLSGSYSQRVWTTSVPASHGSSSVNVMSSNTYLWSNGATSEDISGLAGGTYTVTATTSTGCVATLTATINAPSALSLSATVFDVSCFGGSNGSIDLTVSGGQTPYTFLWSDADVNEDRNAIMAGTYMVTVTDANGCFDTASFVVNQPNDLTYVSVVTHTSCFGASDGAIDLTVNGGTSPYNFSWSTGDVTEDVINQPANFYFFNIGDANGCVTGGIEFINDPAQIVITTFVPNTGGAGVLVTINGSGFTGATNVQFDGVSATSFTVVNDFQIDAIVPPGSDTGYVSVFTNTTCFTMSIDTFFYNPAACLPPSVTGITLPTTCFGASDGSIDITVSGGLPPYTFVWSNGANSEDVFGIVANTYNVTVSDAANCPTTTSYVVTEPGNIIGSGLITNVTCNGYLDGSIDLTVSGGISPYSITWSNGAFTEDIAGLAAGVYTVTIIDNNLCAGQSVFTLIDPPVFSVILSGINPSCVGASDGSVLAAATGGMIPYNYFWNTTATTSSISGVPAGIYNVVVVDSFGCGLSEFFTLNDPAPFTLSVNASTDVDCFGGSTGAIDITASNDPVVPPANPGLLISEFLADPTGSDAPFEWVELIATKNINFGVTPYTVVVANNGAATTKGWRAGGTLTYAFQISTGQVIKGDVFYVGGSSMVPTGTKLRVITTSTTAGDGFGNASASGCFGNGGANADAVGVFNVAAALIDSSTVPVDAIFYGSGLGTAVLNAGVDGYTLPTNDRYSNGHLIAGSFLAPNSAQGFHFRATGSYNFESGVYTTPRVWTVQAAYTDGTSAISLTGINTYLWSNGSTTQDVSGLTAGTYSVLATNPNGCTATASVVISQPSDLVISNFTPSSGPVGTVVTITGTGFSGVDVVNFNGASAIFSIVNDGEISATVPAGATTGIIELINTLCDTAVSSSPFVIVVSSATLNVTALFEGFYDGVSGLVPALLNSGVGLSATECDTIYVELRDQLSPTTVLASGTAVMNINGQASFTFPGSVVGQNGYIAIFHRNAVQTWSDVMTFAGVTNYNFTTAATQAYGSNQVQVAPDVWAMYSGDLSPQDEFIDILDQGVIDNDIFNFASGYVVSDLNGDGFVDLVDQAIVDNNIFNFIGSSHP